MIRWFGSGDIKVAVRDHLESRDDLRGKRVLDIPAGSGHSSRILRDQGATVEAYDLFPEFFQGEGLTCKPADLTGPLPIPDDHVDLALCQEAIEHLADPLQVLAELNRVLKPGGVLLLTTPNVSHLRARVSHLLLESELYNRLPPSEQEAVWFGKDDRVFWGHLFLIGVQRLRTVAALRGFELTRILPVKVSTTSVLLGPLYPLLALTSLFAYWRTRPRRAVHRRIMKLNLHPTILFGKHLFLELRKTANWNEIELSGNKDRATIC